MKNSLIGTVSNVDTELLNKRGAIAAKVTIDIAADVHYDIKIIDELLSRVTSGGAAYICLEKPRKPKRHKKAKISGSKVVKAITDDIAAGSNASVQCVEIPVTFPKGLITIYCQPHQEMQLAEPQGRIINMAIESGLATLCTGTGAVFPAMRDDVDIRAEVLEFARQVKALAVSEACFNEMLERHRNDTAKPDAEVQEPKPSREALIDQFNKTHWVDNVGQGVSWRERELMKKAVLWAHGYKD